MKRIILAVFVLVLFVVPVVSAAPLNQEPDPTGLTDTLAQYAPLGVVVAAVVAGLVNIGKALKVVPDGAAPGVSSLLNLVGFAVFGATLVFGVDLNQYGPILDNVAKVLAALAALLGQVITSAGVHAGLKRTSAPLLSKSFSSGH